jgi:hypothetical protein
MSAIAAIVFTAVSVGLGGFQLCLAAGMPWARFAWGGQHERLPQNLRVGSVIAVLIYALTVAIILARAGLVGFGQDAAWTGPASWAVAGFLGLGTLANLASRSPQERAVMTPIAATMCVCAVLVALGA